MNSIVEFLERNNFEHFEPLKADEIDCVQKEVGYTFPQEYLEWMCYSNGGQGEINNNYIDLWPIEDVRDFYEDCNLYERFTYVIFASDGCGMGYAFSKSTDEIFFIPLDSLNNKSAKKCADSFTQLFDLLATDNLCEY